MSTSRAGTQDGQHTNHANHSHRPHRRRAQNFPPKEYTDLTRTDISLIAPILLPKTEGETRSEYEKRIKKRINELPVHLHCKHSLMSSFCSLHGKLTPRPIISLFNSLRSEIEDEIPDTWGPLVRTKQLESMKRGIVQTAQNLAVLWLGQKAFTERFGDDPPLALSKTKASSCAACTLVMFAADFQTQVALASLFIGRVNPRTWSSSKRIAWFLEWTAARMPESVREDSKKLIWDVGKKFRLTRIGSEDARKKKTKSRVDQEEDDGEVGPGTASYPFSLVREKRAEEKGPLKMIDEVSQEEIDAAESLLMGHNDSFRARCDSYGSESIYSRTMSGTSLPDLSIRGEIEDIISLYEGSGPYARVEDYSEFSGNPFADELESHDEPSLPKEPKQEIEVPKKGRLESMIMKGLRGWD